MDFRKLGRKPFLLFCATVIAGMFMVQGCYYEKPAIAPPVTSTCDTSSVKYNVHVKPILENNCYSCHTVGFPSGGYALDSYTGVKQAVNFGLIPNVFFRTPPARMPKGMDPLTSCEIATIRTWVRNGAPNN